jgi:glycosyltransferase involved in cell wall biosynthesis
VARRFFPGEKVSMINFWFRKDENYISGGDIYNRLVFNVLKERGIDPIKKNGYCKFYQGRGSTYIDTLYTCALTGSKADDIDIMDYRTAMSCSRRHRGKRMIIMFHFDINETHKKRKHRFYFKRFLKNAKDAKIIVIAQYWKTFLKSFGINDIDIVYCAYDVDKYKQYISKEDFLKRFNLPDKPIIYLGKNSKAKTFTAYNTVKSLQAKYLLVTTGPRREFNGPVHLDLNFREYSSLLHLSNVTLLLPRFFEGWSRIAHESVICGTPVIGNGAGGMRELLEKTHQYILDETHPAEILGLIEEITASAKRVEKEDSLYAMTFNLKYFGDKWEKLVKDLVSKSKDEK